MVNGFQPQAVVSVVVGQFWVSAANYAKRTGLPLHLIVHDDFPNDPTLTSFERRWANRSLEQWYPAARSRLCVSPYMADEYRQRYGAEGDVLYPSRASDAQVFEKPPDTLNGPCKPFTVAFGGSIYLEYARALQRMAVALQKIGGRLLVFGPRPYEAVDAFLQEPNLEVRGIVSSSEMIRVCRNEAHAIYIPMSYRTHDRHNMAISFPSKLADCTAMGLPLIVDGPEYCSAVRWARDNPGVSEIVTEESVDALACSLHRLRDASLRVRLAREAIRCGEEYFRYDRAATLLQKKLQDAMKT